MNKHFAILIVVVLAVSIFAAVKPATCQTSNLIVNGNFETGDFTGWTTSGGASISSDYARGSYDARLAPAGATIEQTIAAVAVSDIDTFSFEASTDWYPPETFEWTVTYSDETTASAEVALYGSWQTYNILPSLDTGKSVVGLKLEFTHWEGVSFVDTVQLIGPTPSTPLPFFDSFEDGLANFTSGGNAPSLADVGGTHGNVLALISESGSDGFAYRYMGDHNEVSRLHVSFDFRVGDLPTDEGTFSWDGGGLVGSPFNSPNAGMSFSKADFSAVVWTGAIRQYLCDFTLGTWYNIDVYITLGGAASWCVNDVLIYTASSNDAGFISTDLTYLTLSCQAIEYPDTPLGPVNIYYDNVLVDTQAYVPTPTATPFIAHFYFDANYYYHNQVITTNEVAGFLASEDQPTADTYVEMPASTTECDVTYGTRVFLVGNQTTTELTDGEPVAQALILWDEVSGNPDTEVLDLTATWTVPQEILQFNKDALEFDVYVSFDLGTTWTPVAIYITDHIASSKMYSSELTFHYFVDRYESTTTISDFYFGGGDYAYISGVLGFMFKEATPPEWQAYYLSEQNLVGFVVAPYVVYLGNSFYGIVLLAFCMGLYIRYRNLSPVVLFLILIAGTLVAGGVNIAFGEYVVGIIWAACAFGIALVYWRVFR